MINMADEAVDKQLSGIERIQRWPAGRVLFNEGDPPRGVYVIHSGEVELVFSARSGAHRALRVIGRGDVVGLGDAISNREHDCTATTGTHARLGFIPLLELARVLNEEPSLWLSVARILSADVNSCWASMRRLGAGR